MMYDNDLFIGGKDTVGYFTHYFSSVYKNLVTSTINTPQSATNNNSKILVNRNSYILSITYVLNKFNHHFNNN